MLKRIMVVLSLLSLATTVLAAPSGPGSDEQASTPRWATESWQDFAAHIVASEARGVPQADKVIACTMLNDIERGWDPWKLRARWFGWGTPDHLDRRAVSDALKDCSDIPEYIYVGNINDAKLWRSRGMIDSGPHDVYVGPGGQTVIGVRYETNKPDHLW